jgi:transcriptional regulator NrdR family protein
MIRRRRVCRDCRFRWSTLEAPIGDPALLIEACGLIEPFQAVQAASRHLAETLAAIEPTDPD